MKKIKLILSLLFIATSYIAFGQCDAPANLTTSYSNDTTTFTWDAVSGANYYTLEIRQSDGRPWDYAEYTTTVGTNTFKLTGIMHSVALDWRVQSSCNSGVSSFTQTSFTLPCPEASALFVTSISSNGATLNWTPALGYNTYISDFVLAYRIYNSNGSWISLGHTQNTSLTVTNLQPNTTYEYCINQTCPYATSSPVFGTFTTSAPACAVPTNLTSSAIGNNQATLAWDAVSGAISYTIELKPNSSNTWVAYTSTTNSFVATNLNMNIVYNYRVNTNCTSGSSAKSAVNNFTTQNCISSGNNSQEWIRLFKLGNINRTSGAESGGYIQTNKTTSVSIGCSNVSAQIRAGFAGSFVAQEFSVYIDFDKDGQYETNEKVYGPASITNGNTLKFKFNIPSNVSSGTTGLRVIMARNNTTLNGCLTDFYGETEDYKVNLVGGHTNLALSTNELNTLKNNALAVYPNPAQQFVTVSLEGISQPNEIKIINAFGQEVLKEKILEMESISLDLNALNKGIYFVIVDDKKGNTYSQKIIKQ
jgi:hypothetical protein